MRKVAAKVVSFITWHRRAFAALASAVCVLAVIGLVAPPAPPGSPVLVLQRPVAAGATFVAADLAVVSLPSAAVPEDAFATPDGVVGQVAVTTLTKGTPVTPGVVLSARAPATGHVFVPIRLPDSTALTFIKPGDTVNVVAVQSDGSSKVVATKVRVAAIPVGEIPRGASETASVVVLEVPAEAAPGVSTAGLQRGLSITIG